jgi:ATP-dependent DNA ligase
VRLITRGGYNWTDRYPWIVEAALKNRNRQYVLDGEAVVLGVDGVADFNALHSRKHDHEVQPVQSAGRADRATRGEQQSAPCSAWRTLWTSL